MKKIDSKIKVDIIFWLVFCLITSVVTEVLYRGSVESGFEFISGNLWLFILSISVVAVISSIGFMFTKRRMTIAVLLILCLLLGIANGIVIKFRGTPIAWCDFFSLKEGIAMIREYMSLTLISILCLIFIGILVLVIYCFKKENPKRELGFTKRILFIIFPTILSFIFILILNINMKNIVYYQWDIPQTFKENGYMFSFVRSIKEAKVNKPKEYNEHSIKNIKKEFENKTTVKSDKNPNVILVQLESIINIDRLPVNFKFDPMPTYSMLKEEFSNGILSVPAFGGGTVRTEFEVLTGMNMDFLSGIGIPNNSLLKKEKVETIAHILESFGYDSTLVHNYIGNFYDRDIVYNNFGFNNFISMEYMSEYIKKYNYPSDMMNIEPIKQMLEKDEPQFIFNITVESHGGYDSNGEMDNYDFDGDVTEDEAFQLQGYFNKVMEVDNYIKELLSLVNNLDEPTVILFYSDHLPSIDIINNEKKFNSTEKNLTEYILWDNIGLDKENVDLESYQLSTYLLGKIEKLDGVMPTFHSVIGVKEDYMKSYELIQYDILYGRKYILNSKTDSNSMEFGLGNLAVKGFYVENNKLFIEGTGFNNYSKILLNNSSVETEFISQGLISAEIPTQKIKSLSVVQEGMYGKPLSRIIIK